MLQSNPSVYPYTPFKHRQHDRISFENLQRLLQRQPLPNVHPRGETLAEHILSIFLDPEVYFGPVEFIGEQRTELLNNIQKRIAANQPILFSILGYPFKAPVPLKTRRRDPDLGEALSLQRLFHICLLIEKIYPPGARITIFTEEVFGTFVGATKEHCAHYASGVKMFVQRLGFSRRVTLCPLRKAEEHPLFTKCFTETLYTLEQRYQKKDQEITKKVDGSYQAVFRLIPTQNIDPDLLHEVYDDDLPLTDCSMAVQATRADLETKTLRAILQYFAYLETCDAIRFRETMAPGALPLTVSPKPGRIGIIPINKTCIRLPHHGVPVVHAGGRCSIEYLCEVERDPSLVPVYLDNDTEAKPFYYQN